MDDPSPGSIILKLILVFLLILMNAFFAMSEIAIISLNDNKIDRMAEKGHKKAKLVQKLTGNSNNFLSTIQIGVTLAGFLASAFAAESFVGYVVGWFSVTPDSPNYTLASTIALIVITIIMSYFTLVLGELAPKRIAMQRPEKISFAVIGILNILQKIFSPFVKVLSVSTNAVVRLLGFDPNASEEAVTEEEIRMMVDVGKEKGLIEESQKEMINNIFEFDDIDAADIMKHRTDISAVELHDSLQDVLKIASEEGYSRIPVYEDDIDSIQGVIYVKDLLRYVGKDMPKSFSLEKIIRPALFIPETMPCGQLFTQMSEQHIQIAIVVDEYGGTAGLVTLEDLLESIVGNIQDEYDNEDEDFTQEDNGVYIFDGMADIEDVEDVLGIEFPEDDYETLAGFVISRLGYLPQEHEQVSVLYNGITFTILDVEERRIEKIRIEMPPVAEETTTK